jgi:hypothetical protein
MFEDDFVDIYGNKFLLVFMGAERGVAHLQTHEQEPKVCGNPLVGLIII